MVQLTVCHLQHPLKIQAQEIYGVARLDKFPAATQKIWIRSSYQNKTGNEPWGVEIEPIIKVSRADPVFYGGSQSYSRLLKFSYS